MQVFLKPKRQVSSYVYRDISPVPSTSTANVLALENTPRKKKMKKTIDILRKRLQIKQQKLKKLRAQKKRACEKVTKLSQVIKNLKSLPSLQNDVGAVMGSCSMDFLQNLIDRVNKKNQNKKMREKYDAQLKTFALTLHFYSPRAYNYMRKKFDLCLPHPRTLRGWYQNVDCRPGITKEAIETIKHVAKEKTDLVITLMFDEMSIREHIEFDGRNHHGYVNVGNNIHGDHVDKAKEALVIMAVAVNSFWKIPIAYFFGRGFTATQKATLLKQCIDALSDFVKIISVTFDGIASNINMATILGASLSNAPFRPYFFYREKKYYILLDACHLLKLVRNTFAEYKIFHHNNEIISYEFIENLYKLQSDIGLHLANKITAKHVNFVNHKMNVRLAAQLLSNSVANSLEFCNENLKLPCFENCQATTEFLKNINNLFDIFNSKNLLSHDFKKPLNTKNFEKTIAECDKVCQYIQNLKCNGKSLTESRRKLGFVGFMSNSVALKWIYVDLIESGKLKFLPTYKLSQDHLETFFSAVRSRGGFNNNPTARQFTAAYKRLICHVEVQISDKANCLPLETISILNAQRSHTIDTINSTTGLSAILTPHEDMPVDQVQSIDDDSDFLSCMPWVPEGMECVIKSIVEYICGYVVKKVTKKIKCERCVTVLYGDVKVGSFIYTKDVGGLIYPSQDVYDVGVQSERVFRKCIKGKNMDQFEFHKVVNDCLVTCKNFFKVLDSHMYDSPVLFNHKHLLIKAIIEIYLTIRIKYEAKLENTSKESLRHFYNKLVLFGGK